MNLPKVEAGGAGAEKNGMTFGDIAKIKEGLPDKVLEAYGDSYKELMDNWRSLETKAQGNIAIAGIFIAGAFAFIQRVSSGLRLEEKAGLITALFCLIMSVMLAVRSLRVQIVSAPIFGNFVETAVRRLLQITDEAEFNKRFIYFNNDYAAKWQNILIDMNGQLQRKAGNLENAQTFLVAAILSVAVFAASKVVL